MTIMGNSEKYIYIEMYRNLWGYADMHGIMG
jgi:hypothetical protein